MKNLKKLFAGAALAAVAAAALATVTFGPATGTGFVGKGDIQVPFGWNNQTLQRQAANLAFSYNVVDTYDAECYWETTTGKGTVIVHDITVPSHTSVNGTVAYNARVHSQIDGFNLSGFGTTVREGTAPAVGDACPGNNPGSVIAVTQTSSTGGLFVSDDAVSPPVSAQLQ